MKKVAIVYHYLALYRLPIFEELMGSEEVEYTIYSGETSDIPIKKIDKELSHTPLQQGGLRWHILKNKWFLKKKVLWQSGVIGMALRADYDSYIFLGSPYFASTWFGALIARLRGKKVYYWMHGVYTDKINIVDRIKLFVFYKIAHGFFLYGNRAANIIKKYNVKSPENVHVIYNSLDYNESLKYRDEFRIDSINKYRKEYFNNIDLPVVVFIGRLNFIKRIDMLIEAQAMLKRKYQADFFNLLLIGDGEERKNLENQSKENGLDNNIAFLGAIYDEKINSHCLMNADLCVTPGEVGLTAIHSLSYGTPVISHDNLNIQMPEVEAIVPGITGDLYAYNNIQNLADSIEKWLLSRPFKNTDIIQDCYNVVDRYYNPKYQSQVFNSVLK